MSAGNAHIMKTLAPLVGLAGLAIASLVGYGELKGRVSEHDENIKTIWQRHQENIRDNQAFRERIIESLTRIETNVNRVVKDIDEIKKR